MTKHIKSLFAVIPWILLAATEAKSQQFAIPVTVKKIVSSPPRAGQLLQVSGYLTLANKQPELQGHENGQKISLDFSQSNTKLGDLGATEITRQPVTIIGRVSREKLEGKNVFTVYDAFGLSK